MTMTSHDCLRWLERCTTVLHEQAGYLTELDAAIGDADHGANMDRGFQALAAKFPTMQTMDSAGQLKLVGSTLVSSVGGASGPLYGTAFLRAGTAVTNKTTLSAADIINLLDAFVGGVVQRGKAQAGEKTMLDALIPALDAARLASTTQTSLSAIVTAASDAARTGAQATIPMLATKGRASYLGERSRDHQDPGATSSWLILRSLAEVLTDDGQL